MKDRKVKQFFLGLGTSGRGLGIRKGRMRRNNMDVFCVHIRK
jgi:hypothetical protein